MDCKLRRAAAKMFQLFEIIFQSARSYHGRSLPPRKSTPSVSSASAWGVNLSLVICGSRFFGYEKVPSSNRLRQATHYHLRLRHS
jgi:hypothetical protein